MNEEVLTAYPEGKTAKSFYFAKEVTRADAIVNVCKMKTHALERINAAVEVFDAQARFVQIGGEVFGGTLRERRGTVPVPATPCP